MSGWTCHVERSEGGLSLGAVRLISPRADDRWSASPDQPDLERIAAAGEWIASRLRAADASGLDLLTLDASGAACSWVTSPSHDELVVAASLEQTRMLADEGESITGPSSATSVQLLDAPDEHAPSPAARRAAIAERDVLARLIVDELDARGIGVRRAATLAHAMAWAWDPAGPGADSARRDSEGIVSTSAGLCAVVMLDPTGRLAWSWSNSGRLVACGSMLLAFAAGGGATPDHVSRLTLDWLAWAAQLSVTPSRVICLGRGEPGARQAEASGAMTLAAFGQALARAWAGSAGPRARATVDAIDEPDPVLATLRRASVGATDAAHAAPASIDDPRLGLVRLSNRPGRVHRAMWRWSSIAVAALSGLLGVISWRWWVQAGELRLLAGEHETTWRAEIAQAAPDLSASLRPVTDLRTKVAELRPDVPTSPVEEAKPILDELRLVSEQISGYELVRLNMGSGLSLAPKITVRVMDTKDGESLGEVFAALAGSSVAWKGGFATGLDREGRIGYELQGLWLADPAPGRNEP